MVILTYPFRPQGRAHTIVKQNRKFQYVILSLICGALIVLGIMFLMLGQYFSQYPSLAEQYAQNIFPVISRPFVFLSNLIPISLTEVFVLSLALSSPLLLFLFIYRFVCSENKKIFLLKALAFLSFVFFFVSTVFSFFHGYNYSRYPLEKSLGLNTEMMQADSQELAEVFEWVVMGLEQSVSELEVGTEGVSTLLTDQQTMFIDASLAMDIAAENISLVFSGNKVRSKPVALSSLWSYTQIAGMYNPFFLEANINVDIPEYRLPMIVTHEISHVRGIAREGDANMAAFLACISSPRADFRYSGYLFAFSYLSNDLIALDADRYFEILARLPEQVFLDLNASAEYWRQFEGPAAEVSTQVNDSYLRANRQEEGVLSYSLVSGLIVSYYHTYETSPSYD